MKTRLDLIVQVISQALDVVETDLFGAAENHSLRVAVLCAAMGRELNYSKNTLLALTLSALFHDSALTEYVMSEREGKGQLANMQLHCEKGQRNVECLPLPQPATDYILYHHERIDGKGPFARRAGEFPEEAELISIADRTDVAHKLSELPISELPALRSRLLEMRGERFSSRVTDAFLAVLDEPMLLSLRDDAVHQTMHEAMPEVSIDLADPAVIRIADMVAHVIDYKSVFTKKHTNQIAYRTWWMCEHYGYDDTSKGLMYLAAGLHDLGKIKTPLEVLEKPGKLDADEFEIIKKHVYWTWDWLHRVDGLDDICRWSSSHHEKLDGSGYPFGRTASEMDFNSRLLACIDIYQAVSEERPYHPARSHEATMKIMYSMVEEGLIDADITADMDEVMAPWSLMDVPPPPISCDGNDALP